MISSDIQQLRAAGVVSALDVEFGRVLHRLNRAATPEVLLGAALASRAVQRGHVCLDLKGLDQRVLVDRDHQAVEVDLPELKLWLRELEQSPLVASVSAGAPRRGSQPTGTQPRSAEFRPLVLDSQARLYLWRYYDYQTRLAQNLLRRRESLVAVDEAALTNSLGRLFPHASAGPPDLQRVAALISVCSAFSVISGGPGTGKTTTVVKILAALVEQAVAQQRSALRILLLAPTGKAAQRLAESIGSQVANLDLAPHVREMIPTAASTIHRALGYLPQTPTRFRHGADEPLAADCVLVDESSMVDLALLTKLVEAVPIGAHLILMGDKDQLSSVETGAILGDIFGPALALNAAGQLYSPDLLARARRITGDELPQPSESTAGAAAPASVRVMQDCMVHLSRSYRYASSGGIGALASAINRGDSKLLLKLMEGEDVRLFEGEQTEIEQQIAEQAVRCFEPYIRAATIEEKLALHAQARLLTPHRSGDFGVDALNQICERALQRKGLITPYQRARDATTSDAGNRSVWYENQPILITQNQYQLELFNGDVGLMLRDEAGQLRAWFPAAKLGAHGNVRSVLPARLPPHETVFAMTVHKSQGSEFEQVLLVLPSKPSPVLTRELIYTAVTRARQKVTIYGSREILAGSVQQRIRRASGLSEALWGWLPPPDAEPTGGAGASLPSAPRKAEQLKLPF